jgi:hypothetical protein
MRRLRSTTTYAMLWLTSTLLFCSVAVFSLQAPPRKGTLSSTEREFFEKKIRPILVRNCYECHAGKTKMGGLSLETRKALLAGGASGTALVPGQPEKSLLLQVLKYTHSKIKMPPAGKLPAPVLADFEKWVEMGAPDPREEQGNQKPTAAWDEIVTERSKWWSLQPLKQVALPQVKNQAWAKTPIDRFILAKLEAKGLTPTPAADRRTLARRTAFLLTGLPPNPTALEAFLKDTSPKAYEKWVDSLLASPHYGEQWARHWMDVVRYGETHGYEWNYELRDPWRYRDYLIRAFNADVPYNQFVREHIAGDLLTQPRLNPKEGLNESVIATAFYRFGEVGHDNFREIGYDVIDNQIDTLSKTFQATTLACARCHDHKLDAISSKDYYAMFGVLTSARQVIHTLDTPSVNQTTKQRLLSLKQEIRTELARLWREDIMSLPRYLKAAQKAIAKTPDAERSAVGLDRDRLMQWQMTLGSSPSLEYPFYVWNTLAKNATNLAPTWDALKSQYEKESQARKAFNEKQFVPFGDFRTPSASLQSLRAQGWNAEGLGIEDGFAPAGAFAVAPEGGKALQGIYPAGLYTHLLSDRYNGSLRSPIFPKEKRLVSLQVVGSKGALFRTIPDFRQLGESVHEVNRSTWSWVTHGKSDRDEKIYTDLVTRADNIRDGYRSDTSNLNDQRSFFGITRAVLHDGGETPKDELTYTKSLLSTPTPTTFDAAAQRFADHLTRIVQDWGVDRSTDEDVRWLETMTQAELFRTQANASPRLQELVSAYRKAEKELQAPRVVVGVGDVGNGYDFPVFLRGDFHNHGEVAPRAFLQVLCKRGERYSGRGSGRMELAEKLISPTNPLTARVMVNRVWHHIFGTGIVRTTDDFGHLGDTPSHPELLDYLAKEFMREGWSLKRLIRSLILTNTFKMGVTPSAKARTVDPLNRLLQHYAARRLTAESIRDSILSASGRLDPTLYGNSIDPFRVKPTPERRLNSGPLDGAGRRSIYTRITLMEGPAFLCTFNFPDPKSTQGKRDVTNVPTQALTLMNDPFVVDQAEFWAKRLVTQKESSPALRLEQVFLTAFGRPLTAKERTHFESLFRQLQALHGVKEDDLLTSVPLWKDMVHTVFNMKEFIYLR